MIDTDPVRIIDLWPIWTTCSRCGKDTPCSWGFPVENGSIVPTWWAGWEGGIPACEACYEWHQLWSDRIHRPFEAPLA